MHLEHVNLTVADVERSAGFYAALLGWSERWRGVDGDGRPEVHLGDEHEYVAFFQSDPEATTRVAHDYGRVGVNHMAFVVDDLESVIQRAQDLGVTPHLDMTYEPGRHVYVFDPDGIEIEFVRY